MGMTIGLGFKCLLHTLCRMLNPPQADSMIAKVHYNPPRYCHPEPAPLQNGVQVLNWCRCRGQDAESYFDCTQQKFSITPVVCSVG